MIPDQRGDCGVVGCCVGEEWAARAVTGLIREERARPEAVGASELANGGAVRGICALVYDLAPWTWRASDTLAQLARDYPAIPMLLYLPPTGPAFVALGDLDFRVRFRVQVQGRDAQSLQCLRDAVRWLIRSAPRQRAMRLLVDAVGEIGPATFLFAHTALVSVARGERPTVDGAARALHVSVRTTERRMERDGLPRPKRMLDWLTSLYIVALVESGELSAARAGQRIGLMTNDLYRLRLRLFGSVATAPEWRSAEVVQRLAREVHGSRHAHSAPVTFPACPALAQEVSRSVE